MKVLQVNVNAVAGSTGKIVTDLRDALEARGHRCIVAYGANATVDRDGYVRICSEPERKLNAAISRLTGVNHGGFGWIATRRLVKLIDRERPDVVHLHCPNGYIVDLFKLLTHLGRAGIKTVITNHAEFFYTGTCGHAFDCERWTSGCGHCGSYRRVTHSLIDSTALSWQKMKAAFDSFKRDNVVVASVSPWIMERARRSPILGRFDHRVVRIGVDTSVFHPRRRDGSDSYLLHVTSAFSNRRDTLKGGAEVVELARMLPDRQFVVAAMHTDVDGSLPGNISLLGRVTDRHDIARLYAGATCTLLTSAREAGSTVMVESLCSGTPVVGFRCGGPESVVSGPFARFVEPGDIQSLRRAIAEVAGLGLDARAIALEGRRLFSAEVMTNDYLNIYKELMAR